jgi:parallel beta-helix repeat protein
MKAIGSLVVVAAAPSWVQAVDLLVPEEHTTIEAAVDQARDGDRVLVGPGDHVIDTPLLLGQFAITLQSREGPQRTTIRMVETSRIPGRSSVIIVTHFGNARAPAVDGFTITGGRGSRSFDEEPNVGGGILCESGLSPAIRNCLIIANTARKGGGIYCGAASSPSLQNCTIAGNTARFSGGGIYCRDNSRPAIEGCTVAGNAGLYGGGLYCRYGARPAVKNSILWGNAGASIFVRDTSPVVDFSNVEGEAPFRGTGNLNVDPLFCSWGDREEVFVDPARTVPGDGSRENPFRDLREALAGHSLALSSRSPCRGAGEGGTDMGAETGACAEPGKTSRLVHLLPGKYRVDGINLASGVSIEGAGEEVTVLEGTVQGLRTGSRLTGVTVTGGARGGIPVGQGERPEIRDSWVRGNFGEVWGGGIHLHGAAPLIANVKVTDNIALVRGGGLYIEEGSRPVLVHCTIAGNSAGELGGIALTGARSFLTLKSSIVWNNAGGSAVGRPRDLFDVSFTCLEGAESLADGNISEDPRFCGWPAREVHVDERSPGPGSGTPEDPFPALAAALRGFRLSLASGSPCKGTGEGGTDMGAAAGACARAGEAERWVRIARGSYEVEGLSLASRASLLGSGEEDTIVHGTVHGLRTGSTIEDLTIAGGPEGGLRVTGGESPVARRAAFTGRRGAAGDRVETNLVVVLPGAALTLLACSLRDSGRGLSCGEAASAVLVDCVVSGHSWSGIGVGTDSSLRIEGATVEGNGGAGIFAWSSDLEVRGSTIAGNRTGLEIYASTVALEDSIVRDHSLQGAVLQESLLQITNCLIARNGLIGLELWGSTALVSNSTIVDHLLENFGGGIQGDGQSAVSLHNSILWDNGGRSLGFNAMVRASFTLSEGERVLPGEGNLNVDPLFAGGGDYRLRPGSPAIDAGAFAGAPATDLEGHGRPCGGGIDLGAFEAGGCPPAGTRFRRGEATGDGMIDLADAIASLEHLFRGRPAPPCPKGLDVNDDGVLDLTDPVVLLRHLFLGGPPPLSPFAGCGLDPTLDLLPCAALPECG